MSRTIKDKILAAIKANPGKSSLEISMLLTGVTHRQVSNNALKLAERFLIENRAGKNNSTAWYATRADAQHDDATVLSGPSFRSAGNYKPSPWNVREGSGDAFSLPSRRGNEFVPHSPPMGMCVGRLADGRSLAR